MREAIDSALAQTYPNIEIIVVNDGSNDNGVTESIALSYGNKIKYISKKNGGVSSALNAGIKVMAGDFFSWLSHDDVYSPDKIMSQIEILRNLDSDKLLGICGSKQIDSNSNVIASRLKKRNYLSNYGVGEIVPWAASLHALICQGSFNGCSFIIPKNAFVECGQFDETLRYCQDFLMWIKLFLNGWSLAITPGCHVYSRVHDQQLTVTGKSVFKHDSLKMSSGLIDMLIDKSNDDYNFVEDYAIYNAKYRNNNVVRALVEKGKENNILSTKNIIRIRIVQLYSIIRPIIRSIFRSLQTVVN